MKSIEVIVPRKLISEFYPHPEFYEEFVVKLVNGMYTDVYFRDKGDFITITSDEELIENLYSQDGGYDKENFKYLINIYKEWKRCVFEERERVI